MRLASWTCILFLSASCSFLFVIGAHAQSTPSITSLSPTSAAIGASITIFGTNFGSTQGTSTVQFNGTAASVTTWGSSSITVTLSSGATSGNVVVNVSGQASNGVNFTVVPAPSITELSPATGAVGAELAIAGQTLEPLKAAAR